MDTSPSFISSNPFVFFLLISFSSVSSQKISLSARANVSRRFFILPIIFSAGQEENLNFCPFSQPHTHFYYTTLSILTICFDIYKKLKKILRKF